MLARYATGQAKRRLSSVAPLGRDIDAAQVVVDTAGYIGAVEAMEQQSYEQVVASHRDFRSLAAALQEPLPQWLVDKFQTGNGPSGAEYGQPPRPTRARVEPTSFEGGGAQSPAGSSDAA